MSFTAPGETQSTHGVSATLDDFSRVTSKAVNNGSHTLTAQRKNSRVVEKAKEWFR